MILEENLVYENAARIEQMTFERVSLIDRDFHMKTAILESKTQMLAIRSQENFVFRLEIDTINVITHPMLGLNLNERNPSKAIYWSVFPVR